MNIEEIKNLIAEVEQNKKEVQENARKFDSEYEAIKFAVSIVNMKPGDVFLDERHATCVFVGWEEGCIINIRLDKEDSTLTTGKMSPRFVTDIIGSFVDYMNAPCAEA